MTRRGAAIVNPAVRKFSRLLPVLSVCQMVGGAAVFHSSSYLLGATKFFGTVIGLTVVLVGLLGLAGNKRTNVLIATLTGIILCILLTNALVVEVDRATRVHCMIKEAYLMQEHSEGIAQETIQRHVSAFKAFNLRMKALASLLHSVPRKPEQIIGMDRGPSAAPDKEVQRSLYRHTWRALDQEYVERTLGKMRRCCSKVIVALYPITHILKDDTDTEVQLWRQGSSPHLLRWVQKALDAAMQMITTIDERERHETIIEPDSYYDQALALKTCIINLPAMLGDTSYMGKRPAAVTTALELLFGDDAEDGAEVIRLIAMELPNMKAALGRLRDADKTYAELDMSDVDSVKAAWRAKYKSTSLPDLSDLPRFSSVLRHLPKHCLYEDHGRKVLKMVRWALLAVQVPAAWMLLDMLLRQTARHRDKDW